MRPPFSPEQFFAVFSSYNERVWPTQIVLLGVAIAIVVSAARRKTRSRWPIAALALLWVWMALVYHLAFFAAITRGAILFAAIFLAEAALLLWYGLRRNRLELQTPSQPVARVVGWTLIAYALVIYPLLGYAFGHRYPASPTFGLPCPTTIFTFGLLAWVKAPMPWTLVVVPMTWALVGGSAALQFGVLEDFGLPAAVLLFVLARVAWQFSEMPEGAAPARIRSRVT